MPSTRVKLLSSLAALTVIVGTGSYGTFAAFTDTTSNTGNSFAAGTLDILNVTNGGTLSFASVKLYGTIGGTGLAPFLSVDVDRGTGAAGGSSFSCSGFVETDADIVSGTLAAFPTSESPITETAGWGAGATKSYRIQVTLPSSVTDATAEGKSAALNLHWDATS